MAHSKVLNLATALIMNADGHLLTVRKKNTRFFMQPGGKIDAGETVEQALQRELAEELGMVVRSEAYEFIGNFKCQAANEDNTTINADLFLIKGAVEDYSYQPAAEIEEIMWIDPRNIPALPIAPYTKDHVLPLCAKIA